MRWKRLSRPLALSILAFALQVWRLGEQSLWYDEGFSVWLATRPLPEIVARTAADIHPPLYYMVLAGWIELIGSSEFSLRFLSVIGGVVTVPLMWALGRRTLGAHGGSVAALLVAVSPLWLWYARDARMYTLVTALVIASTWMLLRWLNAPNRSTLIVYVGLTVLAIYTHFFAWFIVAAQVVFGLLWTVTDGQRRQYTVALLVAWAATVLAYLPWLRFVLIRLGADRSYWAGTLPVGDAIETMLETWVVGHSIDPVVADIAAPLVAGLAIGGIGALLIRYSRQVRARRTLLLLASWLVVPVIALLLVSFGRPKYHPRYMMIVAPAFVLALAALPAWLFDGRWPLRRFVGNTLGAGLIALLLGISLLADYNLYTDSAFTKDDWRGAARLLEQEREPDEPILLVSGHAFPVFTYYYNDGGWVPLPDEPTLDTTDVLNWDVASTLAQVLENANGVWLVAWQDEVVDPDRLIPFLLTRSGGIEKQERPLWGIDVRHWHFPEAAQVPLEPPVHTKLDVNFDDELRLIGWEPPEEPLPADNGVPITLYWEIPAPTERDLKVSLEVVDQDGFSWGKLDQRPGSYFHPTFRWQPNAVRPGRYIIALDAGTPPGTYHVEASVYADPSGDTLNVLDAADAPQGRRIRLGTIELEPPTMPAGVPQLPTTAWWHDTELLDGVYLLASQTRTTSPTLEPGFTVPVSLWWRARQAPQNDLGLHIGWRYDGDVLMSNDAIAPGGPAWPAHTWREGELVLTQARVRVPPEMPAGRTTLVAWLSNTNGESGPQATLGEFEIVAGDRTFTAPEPSREQVATFGEVIRLIGYDVSPERVTPGAEMQVTLYWQSVEATERPLTAFVHLLDGQGVFVAGDDHEPQEGSRPTDTWVRGEYVRDTFTFRVPDEPTTGPYRLEVGWYDGAEPDLPRLPADGEGSDGTRVLLQTELTRAR